MKYKRGIRIRTRYVMNKEEKKIKENKMWDNGDK